MNGHFLTIEGIEGAGKSTALNVIQNWLDEKGYDYVLTREPGGTPIAEAIRQILLNPNLKEPIHPEAELLLFFAGRKQHISQVILPALHADKWVISDRYTDATYAYQNGGRGISSERLQWLENWIAGQAQPTLTFLLDVSPEIGLQRAKVRGPHDRIEQETLDFFHRVRNAYLARAKEFPKRICVINAMQSEEKVRDDLIQKLNEFVEMRP